MTVYQENVYAKNIYQHKYQDTSIRMTGFFKLMGKWKGSVVRLIYHNFIIFVFVYFLLSFLYRFVFKYNPYQKEMFELICIYAGRFMSYIPLAFLIGFYVQQVVTRWWSTFTVLPYPDKIALKLVSFCPGKDHFTKNLRRTIMRYVNLSTILVYRLVSKKVKNRFPNMDSLVLAKLLLPHEAERLERVDFRTPHEATWTPVLWALKLLCRARKLGKVTLEPPIYANLVSSFEYIEDCNRKILNYGWVEFPLAYTQVATFSVYAYFLAALFGRQFLEPGDIYQDSESFPHIPHVSFSNNSPYDKHTPDFYIPFFTLVEFISYMGWIKVAETLLNPFGDDDEDFDINYLIDRNLQVSYLIVDLADNDLEMANDPFLEAGISIPEELPYQSDEADHHRANSVKSQKLSKKHSVSLVSINKIKENIIGSNEMIMPSPGPPRKFDSPRFTRQDSQASITNPEIGALRQNNISHNFSPALIRHSPFVVRKLDDLMEVDNEQDTVKSVADLLKNNEVRTILDATEIKNQKNLYKVNGITNDAFIGDESNG